MSLNQSRYVSLSLLFLFSCGDHTKTREEATAPITSAIPEDRPDNFAPQPNDINTSIAKNAEDLSAIVVSPQSHTLGQWGEQLSWPLIAIHATLLPNGKIFTFGTDTKGAQQAYIHDVWAPGGAGHQTSSNGQPTDSFCSATGLLPSGELLIAGGDTRVPQNTGIKDSLIYKMGNQELTRASFMFQARWYPNLTTLPNGEMLIFGGKDGSSTPVTVPEIYNGQWRTVWNALNDNIINDTEGKWFYPRNFVAPNGKVFGMTGNVMFYLDWAGTGKATVAGILPNKTRSYTSTAVMFRPGKILQVGGSTDGDPEARGSNQAVIVDINGDSPKVTNLPNMAFARVWGNSTVLPNGEVLITGGSAWDNKTIESATTAEMWNSSTNKFRNMAKAAVPRLYHSVALLLPDARVLVAGGGAPGPLTNLNAELYSPPYLFNADGTKKNRLKIGTFNTKQDYGHVVSVPFSGEGTVKRVTFIRTGSVTHSFNMSQRFMQLNFAQQGSTVNITLPNSRNQAPPGYYLMFLINDKGAPSVGTIVSLGA